MQTKRTHAGLLVLVAAVGCLVAIALPGAWAGTAGKQHLKDDLCAKRPAGRCQGQDTAGPRREGGCGPVDHHGDPSGRSNQLNAAMRQLDALRTAIDAGRKETALKELAALRSILTRMMVGGKHAKPTAKGFVNVRCPMMRSKLNPAKVTAKLIRTYKGNQVGFCCPGCPAAWDKLSEKDKDAKLAGVLPKADPHGAEHRH